MMRALEKIAKVFDIVAVVALACVVIYLGYEHYYAEIDSVWLILALVAGGLLSSILCCAFHELGHVVFGKACGFVFNSLRIGPVKIYRDEHGLGCTVKEMPETVAGAAEMLP